MKDLYAIMLSLMCETSEGEISKEGLLIFFVNNKLVFFKGLVVSSTNRQILGFLNGKNL